ncbi:MAG: ABC transporter permease subunit, partial [Candidatus Bipolaricaulota bacterium]|nr:ABC transporter permease subunit [Candidatus Bipolaricaulota bacterium]
MAGRDRLAAGAVVLLLVGAWEVGGRLGGVAPYVLPAPSAVLRSFVRDLPLLLHHAGATLGAFGVGLALGVGAGLAVAGLSFYVRPLGRALAPFLVGSQMVPVFAVAPLLVLWFGYGILAKAAVAAMISFFPVAVNVLDGLRSVRPELLEFFQA